MTDHLTALRRKKIKIIKRGRKQWLISQMLNYVRFKIEADFIRRRYLQEKLGG